MATVSHTIGILVFDDIKLLDVAGPADVFATANQYGADYRISMVSVDGSDVRTSMGMRVPVDVAATDNPVFDTLVVSGGEAFPAGEVTDSLASAAFELSGRAKRTASICTGAFVLGAAGLLDGKRATTHWNHVRELAARYPTTRVEADAIFVKDDTTYSSAGVTAGIDLALALLEEDEEIELARSVARALVVYLQREGGQAQFSGSLAGHIPQASLLRTVIEAVSADPAAEYPAARLAQIARVSSRHLSRLFRDELQTTPGKYIELIRLDRAKSLLDEGMSVTEVAQSAGFGTSESLRRAFISHLSIPPSQYRARFSSARERLRA